MEGTAKQQVLNCVFRSSVHLNVNVSGFFNVHYTLQDRQTVSSDIFPTSGPNGSEPQSSHVSLTTL